LKEKLPDDLRYFLPPNIRLSRNYLSDVKYYGMTLPISEIDAMFLTSSQIEDISEAAAYSGNEDLFLYLFNKYQNISLINAAYLSGKAGLKIDYLIKLDPNNSASLLYEYIAGLLESGFKDAFTIINKFGGLDINRATEYLERVTYFGNGDQDIIEYLLSQGAIISIGMINNAVNNYNFEAVKVLLSHSPDLDLTYTVIVAIKTQNRYMVKYLLTHGANADAVIKQILSMGNDITYDIKGSLIKDNARIFRILISHTSPELELQLSNMLDIRGP
jgi:hypothetical protein